MKLISEYSTAEQRRASSADAIGHSSVQPWSAGDLFPCVLARVERYDAPISWEDWIFEHEVRNTCRDYLGRTFEEVNEARAVPSVSYELIAYGRREEYATREDAEQVARALNADPVARARWRREPLPGAANVAFYLAAALHNLASDNVRPHDQAGVS
jgi:hypothetical protein